ncbi:MAG: hypothetical protein WC879_03950 [Melioribacteraceae bacterium]
MISYTTESFRKLYDQLPPQIQVSAKKVFEKWQSNPLHPSIRFKQVHPSKPIYSVRINRGWRALGIKEDETLIWFWIGSHTDYEKTISKI